jgi:ABC-type glycerol-3-phosphate transport system substrate-binding protein
MMELLLSNRFEKEKSMKKSLVLVLAGMLLASMSMYANGTSEKATQGSKNVKITYMSSTLLETPEGDMERAAIERFNALDNGITVEAIGTTSKGQTEKLLALAAANDMPDCFMGQDQGASMIAELDVVADLSTLFDSKYLEAFDKNGRDLYTFDGVLYALPSFSIPYAVLYRKDIFDANGITKTPTTWDEVVKAAQKLTKDGNFGVALLGDKGGSASRCLPVMRNYGVDEFYLDNNGLWQTDIGGAKYIAAIRTYSDFVVKYGVVPPGYIETNYAAAVKLIASGKAAMMITGSNAIGAILKQDPSLKGKLGSFPIPGPERSVSAIAGAGYYITKGSNEKECAEFLKFLVDDLKEQGYAQTTGRLSTYLKPGENDPALDLPELAGYIEAGKNVYQIPKIAGYRKVIDIHGETLQTIVTGMATVEQAAEAARVRAQAVCDEANAN